eukprot:3630689-Amphidinium_carterae.1
MAGTAGPVAGGWDGAGSVRGAAPPGSFGGMAGAAGPVAGGWDGALGSCPLPCPLGGRRARRRFC